MHFTCQLNVVDRFTGQIIGQVVDMSPEGMMLTGEDKITTNKNLYLTMELPEEIKGKTHLDFVALSHWWKKADEPGMYLTGFTLKSLEPADIEIINRLIEKFGKPE